MTMSKMPPLPVSCRRNDGACVTYTSYVLCDIGRFYQPPRDGVDLIFRGASKREKAGVSMMCIVSLLLLLLYVWCTWYEVRRCVFVCWIGRVNHVMLSWLDLLLLCANHTHMRRDYWHKGESLEHGCRCTAAAVLLLYCCTPIFWLRS